MAWPVCRYMASLEDERGTYGCTNNGLSQIRSGIVFIISVMLTGCRPMSSDSVPVPGKLLGKLYFRWDQQVQSFRSNLITLDTLLRPVVLTGVQVLHGGPDPSGSPAGRDLVGKVARQGLILEDRDKVITIGFAALHYADPGGI